MSISSNFPKGTGHDPNEELDLNEKKEEQAQEKKEFHQQASQADTSNKQDSSSQDASKDNSQDNTEVKRNKKLKRALRVMGMGVSADKKMKLQNIRQAQKLKEEQKEEVQKDEINRNILQKEIQDKETKMRTVQGEQRKTVKQSEEIQTKKPADDMTLPPDNDPNNIIRI